MRTHLRTRRGFSLVEIITALTILAILGVAMTKVMLSQTRGYQYDNGGRRSRTAARSAMNIMITDLRMTQDNGGVTYLDATNNRRVDVRVPIAFGVVCSTAGTSVIMAIAAGRFLPVRVDASSAATPFATPRPGSTRYVAGGIDQRGRPRAIATAAPKIYADTVTMARPAGEGRPGDGHRPRRDRRPARWR